MMLLSAGPVLLQGALVTIEIALLAALLASVLALAAALARLARWLPVRAVATVYVEFFRGSSLIVQLFWLFFVLPQFGLSLSPFVVAVTGIGLNYGAYGAEVVRGAILGVAQGQYEAAAALGLTRRQVRWLVILPQAARIMIPPANNLAVQLVKATSLTSLITISELTFRAYQLNQVTMRTAEIFGALLVIYYVICTVVARGFAMLERRASYGR